MACLTFCTSNAVKAKPQSVKSNGMISFTPTKIQPCLIDMPHPPEMFAKSFTDINIDIYIEHPALVLHQVLHYVIKCFPPRRICLQLGNRMLRTLSQWPTLIWREKVALPKKIRHLCHPPLWKYETVWINHIRNLSKLLRIAMLVCWLRLRKSVFNV